MSEQNKLPLPRLELRWEKTGESWAEKECVYSLVIPLQEYDIRSTDVEGNPRELTLKIGTTKVSGPDKPPINNGKVDTPYRDGAHAKWDCLALGGHIPIVSVCGNCFTIIEGIKN